MVLREQSLGGAVAVGFDQDDDVAVFVSACADVFHCPKEDWRALVGLDKLGPPPSEPGSATEINGQCVSELKAALIKSGVNFS